MNTRDDDLDIHREEGRDVDSDDIDVDSVAEQMESTLTFRTGAVEGATRGGDIVINTRRTQMRPEEVGDAEFEVLEEEEEEEEEEDNDSGLE